MKNQTSDNGALRDVQAALSPDIIARFKEAVACKRWPDGRALTEDQLATCMQAIIAWDAQHLPKEERTGFMPTKQTCLSSSNGDDAQIIDTDNL